MTDPIASYRLWCRQEESSVEFEVSLGRPYQHGDRWFCDWSLGNLWSLGAPVLDGDEPGESFSSMHALASAQGKLLRALEFRQNHGASFFTDALEADLIEDLRAFFPAVQRRRPEKKNKNRLS